MSGSEEEEYVDALGVISALERTCELEAKLRQAIQDTHPLTTTLDWDFNAADREREALLAISEQLEYLEDKLREYRFLEPSELENKAVLLGQLDGVRRELVEVVERYLPNVLFGKEVVREVLAFAQVADDSGEQGEEGEDEERLEEEEGGSRQLQERRSRGSMDGFASEIEPDDGFDGLPPGGAAQRAQHRGELYEANGESGLIPAVRRSGLLHRPPRYPTQQPSQGAKESGHGGSKLPPGSPKGRQSAAQQAGTAASPTSLHQQHQLQLAYMQQPSPNRSAFLQQREPPRAVPLGANAVPGAASGSASPGAAATAAALRSASAAAGRQGRRQLDVDAATRGLASLVAGRSTSAGASTDTYSFAPQAQQAPMNPSAGPVSYPPSSYAPSEGVPSSRQSPQTARTVTGGPVATGVPPAGAPPAAPAAVGSRPNGSRLFLLSKLNRAQGGDSAAGSRYDAYSRVSDEDIYGALDERGSGRPASITNPSPRQFGGFVKIRDRLSQADEAAAPGASQKSPNPPRIYGDGVREGTEGWEAASDVHPAGHAASVSLDPPSLPRRGEQPRPARSTPARIVSPPRERLHLAYSSGGAGTGRPAHSASRGGETSRSAARADGAGRDAGGGGGGSLLGRLANLMLTGAAAAAAVVVAQHAGPVVVQKGQEVAGEVKRRVKEQQQQLAARHASKQQRKREEERRQQAQAQRQPTLPWQQGRGMADAPRAVPGVPGGGGMADLPHKATAGRTPDMPPLPGRMADARPSPPARGGRVSDLPPKARQQPAPPPPRKQQQAAADPLPPFLAAAAAGAVPGTPGRSGVAGSTMSGAPGARKYPGTTGQLFPAMPPPDVSASMG